MKITIDLRRIGLVAALLIFGVLATSSRAIVRGTPARFKGTLEVKEQASQPASPATGYGNIWFDTAGIPHSTTDGGVDQELGTTDTLWGAATTNISPLSADDDLALDDGSWLQWGDANPGTLTSVIKQVTPGVLSLGGFAAAAGGWQLVEDSSNGTNYVFITAGESIGGNYTVTIPNATDTLVGKATTDTLTNKTITAGVLTAGTTLLSPLTYGAGTNMTTAGAGTTEFDGKVFYETAISATRQIRVDQQYLAINTPYTLTDATSQQALFGSSNNSIGLAAATSYIFECDFTISSMSATSGNLKFSPAGIGAASATATILSCTYTVTGLDATTLGTAAASSECTTATTTADPITTGDCVVAATGTAVHVHAKGVIRINAAGTIIPAISLTTGSVTPAVAINSWFVIYPVGNGTVTAVGKIV